MFNRLKRKAVQKVKTEAIKTVKEETKNIWPYVVGGVCTVASLICMVKSGKPKRIPTTTIIINYFEGGNLK